MDYARKQKKAKLENWYICTQLGIKLNQWKDIRAGRKRLANEKLDKFLQMTNNRNEWLSQERIKSDAHEWFSQSKLEECYKEFNTTQSKVARELEIHPSAISVVETGKVDFTKSEIPMLLYLYFQDDNNRRYEKETKKKVGRPKKKITLMFSKFLNSEEKEEKEDLKITKALNEPAIEMPFDKIVEEAKDKIPAPTREDFERLQQDNIGLMERYKELQDRFESLDKNYRELKRELERYRYLIDLARPVDISKPYYGFDSKE